MKAIRVLLTALSVSLVLSCAQGPRASEIEKHFSYDIPKDAYPWVWWHWMDGNISKDGIRKDLLWMMEAGVAGLHHFDAGGRNTIQIVPKKVGYLSDEWKDCMRYALHLADSLGIEVGFAGCPGWSCTGGPWVTPEKAIKKLVWTTVETAGGELNIPLPEPMKTVGKYLDVPYADAADIEPWYRDIAVLAVKIPDAEKSIREIAPLVTSSDGEFTLDMLTDGRLATYSTVNPSLSPEGGWIRYEFAEPQTFCSVTVADEMMRSRYIRYPAEAFLILEASEDGVNYSEVAKIPDSVIYGMTVDFPASTGRFWRLRILAGPKDYATKHDMREFVLHSVVKVNHFEEKAGFAAQDDFMKYPTPATENAVSDVRILEADYDAGTLKCSLPEGRWRIYRFGQALTGKKNHPTSPDATGLEVDKLDPEAWLYHFRTYLGLYRETAGDNWGERWLLNDSYEAEQLTWTAIMKEEFKKRKGYELLPWLPALTGVVIGSSEETERFLWDWRDVIGALFCENYDRLSTIIEEFNLKGRFTESHEDGRIFVGDGMDPKIKADIPMSAIWMHNAPNNHNIRTIGQADIHESASVSHIFGQKYVAAESFTVSGAGKRAYTYCPENLKITADIALQSGLNRFVIHESAHQPLDEKQPGTGLFQYGQWFNRHETWANMARPWMEYLARSCYILQQGKYVADVLLYYGEDNSIVGLYGREAPPIPQGYSFDYINPTGIKTALKVKKGCLTTATGMNYKVLLLGKNCRRMSLPVLRQIVSFAEKGVSICGTLPEEPAGINDNTEEFVQLRTRLAELLKGDDVLDVLKTDGVAPDLEYSSLDVSFIHRKVGGMDFYWVRNFGPKPVDESFKLRVTGAKTLEIWNPESGKRIKAQNYSVSEEGISVDLTLDRNCALFLVARRDKGTAADALVLKGSSVSVDGPWEVAFQKGRGAPEKVQLEQLCDWSLSEDSGIRYFSGEAIYRTSITLSEVPGNAVLKLGKVKNLAEVSINGNPCGAAWKAPFDIELPAGVLKEGENVLEVKVANLWVNRIIGDAREGTDYTFTPVVFYREKDKLQPSGLIGPVKLEY